jgi:hypothetical protein
VRNGANEAQETQNEKPASTKGGGRGGRHKDIHGRMQK